MMGKIWYRGLFDGFIPSPQGVSSINNLTSRDWWWIFGVHRRNICKLRISCFVPTGVMKQWLADILLGRGYRCFMHPHASVDHCVHSQCSGVQVPGSLNILTGEWPKVASEGNNYCIHEVCSGNCSGDLFRDQEFTTLQYQPSGSGDSVHLAVSD